jgi:uncharacterized repeat protein (TIGR01451 family)/fimbrial isopeptide formation D2 family protein/LPXTG-motif cell wall-anchored protein
MAGQTPRRTVTSLGRIATAFALLVGTLAIGAVALPGAPAQALAIGAISAQVSNQTADVGTPAANCITYDPPGTATSSAFVTSPNEAASGHGWRSGLGGCPSPLPALSRTNQSTLGIAPSAVSNVTDGVPFLLARATHYNNDIDVPGDVFSGSLQLILAGFDAPNTVSFNWRLWETNNFAPTIPPTAGTCPNPAWWFGNTNCQDQITFTTQLSSSVLVKDGVQYRLIIEGFNPIANNQLCPTTPQGPSPNQFLTNEDATTASCLYATLVQIRRVTVTKVVTVPGGGAAPAQAFNFTTTGELVDSPWQAPGAFSLSAGQTSAAREIGSADTATITEAAPPGPKWALTGLACTEIGANGQPQPLAAATYDLAGRTITLAGVPAPPDPTNPDISCTVMNTYTPSATLTLVKAVSGGTATPDQWNLTATGAPVPPTSGASITGTSGSPAVTGQTVPAGTYALSESGPAGYAQVGWSCVGGSLTGTNVTVADGASATCTVTNRFLSGNVSVTKAITGETAGAAAGATFAIDVSCTNGYATTFSVTVGAVQTTPQLPAGTQCTITETPPTGGLVDGSYAWGPTPAPQSVVVVDGQTIAVTVTNPIVRVTGALSITKVVTGNTAGAGIDAATYPIGYSCTLGATQGQQGTTSLANGQTAVLTGIPAGSVCTITEALATMPGPIDNAWAWDPPSFGATGATPTVVDARTITVTIPQPPTPGAQVPSVAVTVTNNLTKTPGSFTVTKVADPPSGSTVLPGSTITYTVTVTSTGTAPVHDVVITDDLSQVLPSATFGTAIAPVGTVSGPTANVLTWTIGTLPVGAEYQLRYSVVVNGDARGVTLRNAVTGTGDTPPTSCPPGSPCTTDHVTPKWTVAKASVPASGSTVAPGSSVTYTLTVTNQTVAAIARGIVVTDDLSNVVNHATFTGFTGSYQGTAVQSGATITWTPGDVAAGATIQLSYTVTVNTDAVGVTLRNVATGSGATPPENCVVGTDPQCTTTHVTPTWTVAKTSDPASGSTVQPGSTVTYTLTATNQSADATAGGIVVTDDVSSVLGHASFGSFTSTTQGAPTLSGTTIVWNVGDLAPSATATLSYTVTINPAAFGVTIRNVITASGITPPQDCPTGTTAATASCSTTHVTPPQVVVEPPTAPPTAPPAPGSTVPPDKLPETGSNSNGLLLIGALVVLAGVALLLIRRPRRRRS